MVAGRRRFYGRLAVVVCVVCWLRGTEATSRRGRRLIELSYDVAEEQPVGTYVGDVRRDVDLASLYGDVPETAVVARRLRFTVMRGQHATPRPPLDVDATTGVVRTRARLDRERLCSTAAAAGVVCALRVDVALRPVDHFRIVRLTINVLDVNDHAPTFPDRQLSIDVLESAAVGTSISLPVAADPDSPPLSVAEYRAAADADVFRLVYRRPVANGRSGGGFGSLSLQLVSALDRESVDVYRMTIVAVDGGTPARSGSVQLTVRVVDVNDNSPQFEHADYDVTVPEDVAPGTMLLRVCATDPDDGLNGRVVYELAGGPPSAGGLPFAVDNATGAVVVRTSLDRDRGPSRYQFAVSARDMGADAVTTSCVVVVRLTDVNDNAPSIVVDGLLAGEPGATSAETARVTENAREGTFVAHVSVADPDQGAAGRFNCSLQANADDGGDDDVNATDYFRLNQFDENEFQLVTAAAGVDRERRADFRFAVVCVDYGSPSLTSRQQVRVAVSDVNDCAPTFSRRVYEAEIIENNYVGAALIAVSAHDADRGAADNSRLTYSVAGPRSADFRVDPATGEISAVTSFDREATSTVSFVVVARDAGVPSLSGTATVVVSVVDVNDNSPEFDVDEYCFTVDENQPAGTFVGQLSAVDPDSGDNGTQARDFTIQSINLLSNRGPKATYKSHQFTLVIVHSTDNVYNMYKIVHRKKQFAIYIKFSLQRTIKDNRL